jgi:hypothetical protein
VNLVTGSLAGRLRAGPALFAVLAVAAAWAHVPAADALERLTLRNGRSVEGEVVERDAESVLFRTPQGDVRVPHSEIASLVRVEPGPSAAGEPGRADRDSGDDGGTPASRPSQRGTNGKPSSAPTSPARSVPAAEPVDLEQLEAAVRAILLDLASEEHERRAAALDRIVAEWPLTAPALDGALAHADERVRTEAVRLLSEPKLGDPTARLGRRLADPSANVRRAVVRVVRHRKVAGQEDALVRLMESDPSRAVRLEAARTLEVVGTAASARAALAAWERESHRDGKRPYERVLRRVTGESHDDADGWRKAVEDAEYRAGVR